MSVSESYSRREFFHGAAGVTVGYTGWRTGREKLPAEAMEPLPPGLRQEADAYDRLAKLHFNENPYGPCDDALEAMNMAFKYSMRYGYPDGGVSDAIARHHGVERDHLLLGAGSGEILEVVGLTFLDESKKVVGVDPTYGAVYGHATGIKADAIRIPLLDDFNQNIPAIIEATNRHHREVGFVYLCNPNNPTGRTVSDRDVRMLLDGIPPDVPVLIDEAYHHFVEDPEYATAIPYVLEGRPVIVARTFSKLYGMAAMRLGFAVAPPEIIGRMRAYSTGSINALVKWGAVAAMNDRASQERVRATTLRLKKQTTAQLQSWGFDVIPSETNFILIHTRRPIAEVRQAFRERDIAVARPFPPLLDYMRVSMGTPDEMERFTQAFADIFQVGS